MSFHASILLRLPRVQQALIAILQAAYEQMEEDDQRRLTQRQSILFKQPMPVNPRALLQDRFSSCTPIGFLDVPPNPRSPICAIAEILIDRKVEPIIPKFSIPLSILVSTARSPRNNVSSTLPSRLVADGMAFLVRTYLQARRYIHKITSDAATAETNLDVVFYVEKRAGASEPQTVTPVVEPSMHTMKSATASFQRSDHERNRKTSPVA